MTELCFDGSEDPAALALIVAEMHRAGCTWHIPLIRAVAEGRIALAFVLAHERARLVKLDRSGRPSILILSDDEDGRADALSGWPSLRRIMCWARGAIIHASGGLPEHYELAVQVAEECQKLLIIDTAYKRLSAWISAVETAAFSIPIRLIVPPLGCVHSIREPRQ